jgi:hypothetical protein
MVENDLRVLFLLEADAEQPLARISVPAASRRARIRQRRHRALAFASPVLAGLAVVAVALATTAAPTLTHGAIAAGNQPDGRSIAPRQLSPLRPYASFGPAGNPAVAQRFLNPAHQVYSLRSPMGQLGVFAAGQCRASGQTLTCSAGTGAFMLPERQHLGVLAGRVNGHQARWKGGLQFGTGGTTTFNLDNRGDKVTLTGGVSHYFHYGVLQWQYARGGWAELAAPSEHAALELARGLRFGPDVAAPARFPVQVIDEPASWQVSAVTLTTNPRHDSQWAVSGAHTPWITSGLAGGSCAKALSLGPGEVPRLHPAVINGYQVETTRQVVAGHQTVWYLCAPDADGLYVILGANSPAVNLTGIFAHHLRLLGPDPANWTTRPIG